MFLFLVGCIVFNFDNGTHSKCRRTLPLMLREAEQAASRASTCKTTPQPYSETSSGSSGEHQTIRDHTNQHNEQQQQPW
jgi:hypothetical protein